MSQTVEPQTPPIQTMRALVSSKYGSSSVLSISEIPTPHITNPSQIIIKTHAASTNYADVLLLAGKPFLVRLITGYVLNPPKNNVLGSDAAGEVVEIGQDVTKFKVGDCVFAQIDFKKGGSISEYCCLDENEAVHLKPDNLSFEQASTLPLAGSTAYQAVVHDAKIKEGQKVLVNGASGGVGVFILQIAKSFGAVVTGVCSTKNVEYAKQHGADFVVDYTKDDFTLSTEKYDVIFDIVGNRTLKDFRKVMTKTGSYFSVGGDPNTFFSRLFSILFLKPWVSQTLALVMSLPSKKNLMGLKKLAEEGKITPLIERTLPLAEGVEAIKFLEAGHAQGKTVIKII